MAFRGDKNSLIHSKKGRGDDSGFEALVYAEEKKMFYVVIEAVEAQRNPFHEAKINHPSDRPPTAKAKKTNADEKAENEKSDQKPKQDADQRGARSDSDKDSYHAIIEELRMPFLFDNRKDKSEQKEEAYTSVKKKHKQRHGTPAFRSRGELAAATRLTPLSSCLTSYVAHAFLQAARSLPDRVHLLKRK